MGPKRVYEMLPELLSVRMNKRELRTDDPVEAAYLFISLCTGRFWSQGDSYWFGSKPS